MKNPSDWQGFVVLSANLSLIGKSIGADNAFVKLNRSFGIARLVFVPEVHIVQAKSLRETFIPLKFVQQRPCSVALHIDSVFDSWVTKRSKSLITTKK